MHRKLLWKKNSLRWRCPLDTLWIVLNIQDNRPQKTAEKRLIFTQMDHMAPQRKRHLIEHPFAIIPLPKRCGRRTALIAGGWGNYVMVEPQKLCEKYVKNMQLKICDFFEDDSSRRLDPGILIPSGKF